MTDGVDDERAPRAGRRRSGRLVAAVAVVAVVGASTAAVVSWRWGSEWEDVAAARGERVQAFERQLAEVEAQRDEAEDRLDTLAAEKALAEDERAAAQARQRQLEDLTVLAARIANDLEACVVGTSDLLDVLGEVGDFERGEVVAFAAEVDRVCAQALAGNRALQQAAADLRA